MAGRFQPPPTYAIIEEDESGNFYFSPIWLQWFNDLTASLGTDGTPSETITDGLIVNSVFGMRPGTVYAQDALASNANDILMTQVFGP